MTHQFVVPAWARLGTAAVMAAAVLSGCTGSEPDPGPTGATATSPTESATESPTPTEEPTETSALPPLPEEATENTPEGAEAFIRYYFDVANESHLRPQSGLVSQISDDDCVSCRNMEQQIEEMIAGGWRTNRGPYAVQSLERLGGGPPDVVRFNATVNIAPTSYVNEAGEEGEPSQATILQGIVGAIWKGDRWVLYDMELA